MAAGDLLKVVLNQTMNAEVVQNVLYWLVESDDTVDGNEKGLADALIAGVVNVAWAAAVSNELSFDCMSVQKVFPDPEGAVQDFNIGTTGALNSPGLPATDSALLQKFNPAVGGKGKKGRVYVAGVPKTNEDFGRITSGSFGLYETLAASLATNVNTGGGGDFKPAWAVRNTTPPFSISGFVSDLVWAALPRIATQRRRRTPVRATS